MIAARWQAGAAFGVAAVALVAGLIASRGPSPEDELEKFGRLEAARADQRKAAQIAIESAAALDEPPRPADLDADSLVIAVGADDTLAIGGQTMTPDEVEANFRAVFVLDPETRVVFKADPGVVHGRIVDLMERAKSVGLTRMAISTTDSP